MTERFRPGSALLWASTWGVGVAIGVALGGWLTVVGGAGTPGVEALDLTEDVVLLPGLAGSAVFLVHLAGQGLVFAFRSRRASGESHRDDEQGEHAEDKRVER